MYLIIINWFGFGFFKFINLIVIGLDRVRVLWVSLVFGYLILYNII